jgi:hypothetical protein
VDGGVGDVELLAHPNSASAIIIVTAGGLRRVTVRCGVWRTGW